MAIVGDVDGVACQLQEQGQGFGSIVVVVSDEDAQTGAWSW